MRTNEAKVKLVLKRGMIYISVSWKGRILKSTGVKCSESKWDVKREKVKGDVRINAYLSSLKADVVKRRDYFVVRGLEYTASMLFEKDKADTKANLSLLTLVDIMADERKLRQTTATTYRLAVNKWRLFNSDNIKYITAERLNDFVVKCKRSNTDSTIRMYLQRLGGIVQFAISKDIIKEDPFKNLNIRRKLKVSQKHPALNKTQMDAVLERLMVLLHNEKPNEFKKKISPSACLSFFCFSYLSGGLAPIDVAKVRVSDIRDEIIGDARYYTFSVKRQKTNVPVKCLIMRNELTERLMSVLCSNGNRLFGLIEDIDDDITITRRINYLSYFGKKMLYQELIEVNRHLTNKIDINTITFYSARHTLATVLVNSNVSLNGIASVMGRSVNNIGTYIKTLNTDNELARIIERLY